MKILNIIETAYRATLEEQDDTVIWLSHSLKDAGAEADVLLQGNAVNYIVASQQVSGLKIGSCRQTQAPKIADNIEGLIKNGCTVYVVSEDLDERGIEAVTTVDGVRRVSRKDIPVCMDNYQQVWHW